MKAHIHRRSGRWYVRFPPPLHIYNRSLGQPYETFRDACGWARHIYEMDRRDRRDQKRVKTKWWIR